jgi:hypothetical protein
MRSLFEELFPAKEPPMRSPEDFPAKMRRMVRKIRMAHSEEAIAAVLSEALMERDRAATERAAKIAEEWPMFPFAQQIAAAIRSQP